MTCENCNKLKAEYEALYKTYNALVELLRERQARIEELKAEAKR